MDLELDGTNVTRPVVRHFLVVAMAFGLWAGLVLLSLPTGVGWRSLAREYQV